MPAGHSTEDGTFFTSQSRFKRDLLYNEALDRFAQAFDAFLDFIRLLNDKIKPQAMVIISAIREKDMGVFLPLVTG
jgi:hypothetical protein